MHPTRQPPVRGKPNRRNPRLRAGAGVVLALLIVAGVLWAARSNRPPPPLPFPTAGWWHPPTNGLMMGQSRPWVPFPGADRLAAWTERQMPRFPWPRQITFPVAGPFGCGLGDLLYQATQVSGWQYLADPEVAACTTGMRTAKPLTGREWVTAMERYLTQNPHAQTSSTGPTKWIGRLMLVRFPEQRVVLVLPVAGLAEFRRTNGLRPDDPRFQPPPPLPTRG